MTAATYDDRLNDLEQRVRRLERHAGFAQAEIPQSAPAAFKPPPSAQTLQTLSPIAAPSPRVPSAPVFRSSLAPPPLPPQPHPIPKSPAPEQPVPPPPAPAPAPAPVLTYPTVVPAKPLRQNPLEQVIGIKWAGWIGAIVFVIGAALGIKYAYDQGFFPTVPPSLRLILMSLGSFSLIGAGEWVYRKVGRLSATGLFGAGVATLFVISYAGHGYYNLYTRDTAFIMMALCTLIGAGVSMRGGLVSIAVLSLIGGNVAPIILATQTPHLMPFLFYLLMLQVVALVLAFWGASEKWWTLRGLSLATTSVWLGILLEVPKPTYAWGPVTWFCIVYAALFHAEVLLSTFRRRLSGDAMHRAGIAFTLITTAAVSAAMLRIFSGDIPAVRATWLLTFASIATILSILLRRTLRPLAISYRVQAAILLLVSVPMALHGPAVSIGWAAVAVALAAVGAMLNDRTSRAAGIVAWVLALAHLGLWTSSWQSREAHQIWVTFLGQPLAAWTILMASIGLAGHIIAQLVSHAHSDHTPAQRGELENVAMVLSALSTAVFAIAAIAALPPLGATGVLIVYAWCLVALDRPLPRLALLPQAWVILAIATIKWAAIDTLAARIAPGWSASHYMPILNPLMGTAVALAGSLVAVYWLRRHAFDRFIKRVTNHSTQPAIFSLIIMALLLTFGLSFEVDRIVERMPPGFWPAVQLKLMGLTILWSLAAAAYLIAHAMLNPDAPARKSWRAFAWTLCAALAGKFIFIDTGCWWFAQSTATAAPLLNFQIFTAAAILVLLAAVFWVISRAPARAAGELGLSTAHRVALAATFVILWAGTLEIQRAVTQGLLPGSIPWQPLVLKNLLWTAWWMIGLTGFLAYATRLDPLEMRASESLRNLTALPSLLAIKFIVFDTLAASMFHGSAAATVLVNPQVATGAIVLCALLLLRHLLPHGSRRRTFFAALCVVIPLWCGTLEIDRAFEHSTAMAAMFADPRLAKQVAFSIFFSIYAIAAVALGFRIRAAGLRYFGLVLFALTLAKVGLLDLSRASTGYRFLSFIGLGALLLVTSVIYGQLSPRLLRAQGVAEGEKIEA